MQVCCNKKVFRAFQRWLIGALLTLGVSLGAAPALQAHPHARFSYQLDPPN